MNPNSKRLRVGFDARWHNGSGVGTYVAELLRAMAASRAVELVVYEHPGGGVPGLDAFGVERITIRAKEYSAAGQIEMARRARQDRLDVFHSPFYMSPFLVGCPLVVTIHDLIPFMFPVYSRAKSTLVKAGYRLTARKAACIISVSRKTAADVQNILGVDDGRNVVVHNAARERFQPVPQADEAGTLQKKYGIERPYVLAASASNWRTKNLEGALKALEVALARGAQFQTVIYGPEQGLHAAGGRARWNSLDPKVPGQVETAELAMLFRNATAFIMPSFYEGFGLPVVEAMACGCAVVTSNRGSLAEIVGEGAQVLDPLDIHGMGEAVRMLLMEPETLRRWKAAALKRAAAFSWQRAAEETISVYHRAYREGAARG